MKNKLIALLPVLLALSCFSQEQEREIKIDGGIMPTYQQSILKEKLNVAKTMSDLNPGYPSSWIKRHYSAAVETTCNGKVHKATSPNDTLTVEQINILAKADIGTEVLIKVQYNPSLYGPTEVREIAFTYTIIPKVVAKYSEGEEALQQYLIDNAVAKIPKKYYRGLELATVSFTINEQGQVVNAKIDKSSEVESIDDIMLTTIVKMKDWIPAEDAQGEKVKQDFEFRLGYMTGC